MAHEPLVSVVTPFYNTAPYLAACIDGVLAQTYRNFEYLLVDNCSTDGGLDIARRYAELDPRVRVVAYDEFLGQTPNFNRALRLIDASSKYVKMALADDLLFPECVARMVALAERAPSVGLVSSYRLFGRDTVDGVGLPFDTERFDGREACATMLRRRRVFTGSQNTVLYRADLVRARSPFYPLGRPFADTDAAFELLLTSDLGFVHQVLSFTRTENDSLWSRSAGSNDPMKLYFLLTTELYGSRSLSPEELERLRREIRGEYYAFLGAKAVGLPPRAFWSYHREGLAAIGQDISWMRLVPFASLGLARRLLNPGDACARLLRRMRGSREPPASRAQRLS